MRALRSAKPTVAAPAMQPRPGLGWKGLAFEGHWRGDLRTPTADGKLAVQQLQLPGGAALRTFDADLLAARGLLSLQAQGAGLRLPGPQWALLETDPIAVDGSIRLDDAALPFALHATQRLFDLRAQGRAAVPGRTSLDLQWHDVTKLAPLAGLRLRGALHVQAALAATQDGVDASVEAAADRADGPVRLQAHGAFKADVIASQVVDVVAQAKKLPRVVG